MITWTTSGDGHYHSVDGRFEMYMERLPENDHRLTWTVLDKEAEEGVENGFDYHVDAVEFAERLNDKAPAPALDPEAVK